MGFRGILRYYFRRNREACENLLLLLQSRGKEAALMKNIKYTVTHPIFVFMKKHFARTARQHSQWKRRIIW